MARDYTTVRYGQCLEITVVTYHAVCLLQSCRRVIHKMDESQLRERLILRQSLAAAQQARCM